MEQLDKADPYSIVKLTSVSSKKQMGGGVKCSLTASDYRPESCRRMLGVKWASIG